MRSAILSDIHGNLVALRAVLDVIEGLSTERVLCLGDIVGYNPWPNECVQVIRERSIPCVMGNHDRVAAGLEEPESFNASAREAILWTRGVLTQEHRNYLAKIPDRRAVDGSVILVHGAPRDPDEYILTSGIVRENIIFMEERLDASLGFFGHTHVSGIFDGKNDRTPIYDGKYFLKKGHVCLVNPGSVGQPRDRDPRASFLIYDDEEMSVQYYRVEYDIVTVYDSIVKEGLPGYLGKRLFLGA